MKKVISLLLVLVLGLTPLLVSADIFLEGTPVTIIIDGQTLDIPEEMGVPVMLDGRNMVPVRFILEHLGFTVDYKDSGREETIIAINNDSVIIVMCVDYNMIFVGENSIEMDVNVQVVNDRAYLPIRFLLEGLGYDVQWDEASTTINVNKIA